MVKTLTRDYIFFAKDAQERKVWLESILKILDINRKSNISSGGPVATNLNQNAAYSSTTHYEKKRNIQALQKL